MHHKITIFTLFIIFLIPFQSKSAAEDDGLVFDRLVRILSAPVLGEGEAVAPMKRIVVLDTVDQLRTLNDKMPEVAMEVLVLDAFDEDGVEVNRICSASANLKMLGKEKYEKYIKKRTELGESRAAEAKLRFSLSDLPLDPTYDQILFAGEGLHLLAVDQTGGWYTEDALRILKPGGHVYFMDCCRASWDVAGYSGLSRFHPEVVVVRHLKGHALPIFAPQMPWALQRIETIALDKRFLPESFSRLRYLDVAVKVGLRKGPREG